MKLIRFYIILAVIALATMACSFSVGSPNQVTGSGVIKTEERSVKSFTGIELKGSADVNVIIGEPQSVIIETDDNVLPLIRTAVNNSTLVINWQPNTNLSNYHTVLVTITVPSLESARLSGSGNITVAGLGAADMRLDLPGSGNITAKGSADRLQINLGGSGNILCKDLQAQDVKVGLNGSGNIQVYAANSLDATISGSGAIYYSGSPAKVEKNTPGSGSISPMP